MSSVVEGKQVLVTGATGGIGFLTAQALLRAGARVSLHGRDEAKLARAAAELARDGRIGATLAADLASLAEVAELAARVARELPQLDVLVNNAGVGFGADRRRRELSRDGSSCAGR